VERQPCLQDEVSSPVKDPPTQTILTLLEAMPDAIVGVWPDGRIAVLNSLAESLFGYSRKELIGQPLEVLVPEGFRQFHPLRRVQYQAAPQQRPMGAGMELAGRRKDGVTFLAEISLSVLQTEAGPQVLAAVRDLTDWRRADAASAQLAAIVRSSQDAIIGQSQTGMISSWNPGAELLYGYSAHDIVGSHFTRLMATELWAEQEELLRRTVEGERIAEYEMPRVRKDGSMVDVSITLSPMLDLSGRIVGVGSISRDVTARKQAAADTRGLTQAILNILEDFSAERERLDDTQRAVLNILDDFDEERVNVERANTALRGEIQQRASAEESLQARTGELINSNAELEQFAYVASHDLQEPLRKIGSFCQLLSRRYSGQLDETADVYIGYVVDGVLRMQQLIDDLLTFARLGQSGANVTSVDCQQAVQRCLDNLAVTIDQSTAEISVAEALPVVAGEPSRVVQLFQNVLANSLKFCGDKAPRVAVSAERHDAEWVFSVVDHGIGIDPQYADRVFSVFQRLHTREEYPGTGIGLAICKKIVEQMGGRIWFEPTPGGGTTFSWTIPHRAEVEGV
jgi:PAS domain S-box-containing protein